MMLTCVDAALSLLAFTFIVMEVVFLYNMEELLPHADSSKKTCAPVHISMKEGEVM